MFRISLVNLSRPLTRGFRDERVPRRGVSSRFVSSHLVTEPSRHGTLWSGAAREANSNLRTEVNDLKQRLRNVERNHDKIQQKNEWERLTGLFAFSDFWENVIQNILGQFGS